MACMVEESNLFFFPTVYCFHLRSPGQTCKLPTTWELYHIIFVFAFLPPTPQASRSLGENGNPHSPSHMQRFPLSLNHKGSLPTIFSFHLMHEPNRTIKKAKKKKLSSHQPLSIPSRPPSKGLIDLPICLLGSMPVVRASLRIGNLQFLELSNLQISLPIKPRVGNASGELMGETFVSISPPPSSHITPLPLCIKMANFSFGDDRAGSVFSNKDESINSFIFFSPASRNASNLYYHIL